MSTFYQQERFEKLRRLEQYTLEKREKDLENMNAASIIIAATMGNRYREYSDLYLDENASRVSIVVAESAAITKVWQSKVELTTAHAYAAAHFRMQTAMREMKGVVEASRDAAKEEGTRKISMTLLQETGRRQALEAVVSDLEHRISAMALKEEATLRQHREAIAELERKIRGDRHLHTSGVAEVKVMANRALAERAIALKEAERAAAAATEADKRLQAALAESKVLHITRWSMHFQHQQDCEAAARSEIERSFDGVFCELLPLLIAQRVACEKWCVARAESVSRQWADVVRRSLSKCAALVKTHRPGIEQQEQLQQAVSAVGGGEFLIPAFDTVLPAASIATTTTSNSSSAMAAQQANLNAIAWIRHHIADPICDKVRGDDKEVEDLRDLVGHLARTVVQQEQLLAGVVENTASTCDTLLRRVRAAEESALRAKEFTSRRDAQRQRQFRDAMAALYDDASDRLPTSVAAQIISQEETMLRAFLLLFERDEFAEFKEQHTDLLLGAGFGLHHHGHHDEEVGRDWAAQADEHSSGMTRDAASSCTAEEIAQEIEAASIRRHNVLYALAQQQQQQPQQGDGVMSLFDPLSTTKDFGDEVSSVSSEIRPHAHMGFSFGDSQNIDVHGSSSSSNQQQKKSVRFAQGGDDDDDYNESVGDDDEDEGDGDATAASTPSRKMRRHSAAVAARAAAEEAAAAAAQQIELLREALHAATARADEAERRISVMVQGQLQRVRVAAAAASALGATMHSASSHLKGSRQSQNIHQQQQQQQQQNFRYQQQHQYGGQVLSNSSSGSTATMSPVTPELSPAQPHLNDFHTATTTVTPVPLTGAAAKETTANIARTPPLFMTAAAAATDDSFSAHGHPLLPHQAIDVGSSGLVAAGGAAAGAGAPALCDDALSAQQQYQQQYNRQLLAQQQQQMLEDERDVWAREFERRLLVVQKEKVDMKRRLERALADAAMAEDRRVAAIERKLALFADVDSTQRRCTEAEARLLEMEQIFCAFSGSGVSSRGSRQLTPPQMLSSSSGTPGSVPPAILSAGISTTSFDMMGMSFAAGGAGLYGALSSAGVANLSIVNSLQSRANSSRPLESSPSRASHRSFTTTNNNTSSFDSGQPIQHQFSQARVGTPDSARNSSPASRSGSAKMGASVAGTRPGTGGGGGGGGQASSRRGSRGSHGGGSRLGTASINFGSVAGTASFSLSAINARKSEATLKRMQEQMTNNRRSGRMKQSRSPQSPGSSLQLPHNNNNGSPSTGTTPTAVSSGRATPNTMGSSRTLPSIGFQKVL